MSAFSQQLTSRNTERRVCFDLDSGHAAATFWCCRASYAKGVWFQGASDAE